jgi:hypothetical protein
MPQEKNQEFRVAWIDMSEAWERLHPYVTWSVDGAARKLVDVIGEMWSIELVPLYADYDGLVEVYDNEFRQFLIQRGRHIVRKDPEIETFNLEGNIDIEYAKANGYAALLVINIDKGASVAVAVKGSKE